jgi:CBS domain-containing protein
LPPADLAAARGARPARVLPAAGSRPFGPRLAALSMTPAPSDNRGRAGSIEPEHAVRRRTTMKTVSELMMSAPQTCRPTDTLNRAAELMWEHDCGCLPVVDDERRLVGMITDRDACMAAYTQGRRLEDMPVRSAMSGDVRSCHADDSLATAEHAMQQHQVRRLPVVDAERRVVGILSLNDIAVAAAVEQGRGREAISRDEVATTLGAICKRRLPALQTRPAGRPERRAAAAPSARAAGQPA